MGSFERRVRRQRDREEPPKFNGNRRPMPARPTRRLPPQPPNMHLFFAGNGVLEDMGIRKHECNMSEPWQKAKEVVGEEIAAVIKALVEAKKRVDILLVEDDDRFWLWVSDLPRAHAGAIFASLKGKGMEISTDGKLKKAMAEAFLEEVRARTKEVPTTSAPSAAEASGG